MAIWSLLYGNDELALTGRAPFDVVSIEGIGGAPVRRLTGRAPFQDGDSDLGFRLDARLINLVLHFNAENRALADAYRDQLFAYAKPQANAAHLRCLRDDGNYRQIDVHPVGVLDAPINDQDRLWSSQRMAVQLRAAEPVWYDPQIHYWAAIGSTSTGLSGYQSPMMIPMVQTAGTVINVTIALPYAGSWATHPIMTLFGPGTGWKITNVTTGDMLNFPNLALSAGQWLEIDLRYGHKTVLNQAGANRISELSADSDLSDWHIAPAPEAVGGTNLIKIEVASAASDASGVQVAYYDRYISL